MNAASLRSGRFKRHRASLHGLRVDMTPLVSVAFLLLTWFMGIEQWSAKPAFEINRPETGYVHEYLVGPPDVRHLWIDEAGQFCVGGPSEQHRVAEQQLDHWLSSVERHTRAILVLHMDPNTRYDAFTSMLDRFERVGVQRWTLANWQRRPSGVSG